MGLWWPADPATDPFHAAKLRILEGKWRCSVGAIFGGTAREGHRLREGGGAVTDAWDEKRWAAVAAAAAAAAGGTFDPKAWDEERSSEGEDEEASALEAQFYGGR